MTFDVEKFRSEFPILDRKIGDKSLIYFDNAASGQKPAIVLERMERVANEHYANVHRGLHRLANETTQEFENARDKVAQFLNATSSDEIIFTKNATEAINLVAWGMSSFMRPGDRVVVSIAEHHSNFVPWMMLKERLGIIIEIVGLTDDLELDMKGYANAIDHPDVRMVALTHMSNALGFMTDAKQIVDLAHEAGVPVLLDGCQAAVHQKVDVKDLDVDYYVFAPHKLYGPSGAGVLYGKHERLEALPPFLGGGEMIDTVTTKAVTFADLPHKFEAGTPPILEVIGLGAAINWLNQYDRDELEDHVSSLRKYALDALSSLNYVQLYNPEKSGAGLISFNIDNVHPHDVAQVLDQYAIAIRAGHHCAQPLMNALSIKATARASFAPFNEKSEIDIFVEALHKAHQLLG